MADIDYKNLIRFSDNGIVKADFAEIVTALTNRMKEIYGYDIDVSMTSADGIKIMDTATIIDKVFECVEEMYSSLNVNTATGKFLDMLCALSNVYRRKATKSKVAVYITINGTNNSRTYTTDSNPFLLVDKNTGKTWRVNESFTISTNMTDQSGNVVANPTIVKFAECDETGDIALPPNSLELAFVDADIIVNQPKSAVRGEKEETDSDLRTRRAGYKSTNSISVIGGLKSALLDVGGIKDAKIYSNNTGATMLQVDTQGNTCSQDIGTIPANQVYIALRYEDTPELDSSISVVNNSEVIVNNDEVGSTIFKYMTPAIHTTECENDGLLHGISGEYTNTQYGGFTTKTYWKICQPYVADATNIFMTVQVCVMNNFRGLDVEPVAIAKAVGEYMNKLKIGQAFNIHSDILPIVMNAGISAVGETTYYCATTGAVLFKRNSENFNPTSPNVNNSGCTYYKFQGIATNVRYGTVSGMKVAIFNIIQVVYI